MEDEKITDNLEDMDSDNVNDGRIRYTDFRGEHSISFREGPGRPFFLQANEDAAQVSVYIGDEDGACKKGRQTGR